ncbi:hypothetical protein GTA62_02160 [Roseobacter sp. HKCCD9010]|nr:hypothetical protein [Rhodobacterales bacterium HKCCD4356]NNV11331.1 hypothetical protein [Roseobacter sp. HKCCD7357]NNV15515.1 hypothetical protein [Roseobacter sp. HKCCD8768]NNV24975.1 hypothetical protein [Roseobacter sp. HKCCD8192]NNV29232.1 hypothetical protein [Roseobacter sp. HKCCD9061]NNV33505.1 hypothetical protein [Roseobacter sp. HKCCD9073]NNV37755.1 hypothetical protein [Roseobacter sp. HKCCD9054]NNV41712.1 hypothetical protein [Roseobacter sp. HKCCD6497]NNV45966.1 hypothetic
MAGLGFSPVVTGFAALCLLAACVDGRPVDSPNRAAFYDGVETRLLDDELVNFQVQMTGMATRADVEDYAKCAAAQYTLIRGYGFARHVRTNVQEEGGVWRGDAVYTISPALPRGLQTLDAEVVAAACAEQGIPTV